MSCNGCRVLRRGCSKGCMLRSSLHCIEGAEAQGNATSFLTKFWGRTGLFSFLSSVQEHQRPALFRSLLFEACGRTLEPVYGAVGLLRSGNWYLCDMAAEIILSGGKLHSLSEYSVPALMAGSEISYNDEFEAMQRPKSFDLNQSIAPNFSDEAILDSCPEISACTGEGISIDVKLLNLFH